MAVILNPLKVQTKDPLINNVLSLSPQNREVVAVSGVLFKGQKLGSVTDEIRTYATCSLTAKIEGMCDFSAVPVASAITLEVIKASGNTTTGPILPSETLWSAIPNLATIDTPAGPFNYKLQVSYIGLVAGKRRYRVDGSAQSIANITAMGTTPLSEFTDAYFDQSPEIGGGFASLVARIRVVNQTATEDNFLLTGVNG